MDCSLKSGKMEFSLSFTNVAERILIVQHFWIFINVSLSLSFPHPTQYTPTKICDN